MIVSNVSSFSLSSGLLIMFMLYFCSCYTVLKYADFCHSLFTLCILIFAILHGIIKLEEFLSNKRHSVFSLVVLIASISDCSHFDLYLIH